MAAQTTPPARNPIIEKALKAGAVAGRDINTGGVSKEAQASRSSGGSSGGGSSNYEGGSSKQQEAEVKQAQREQAARKVGAVTRVTTDQQKQEVTYHGVGGQKYTMPIGALSFTSEQKPGGIPESTSTDTVRLTKGQEETISREYNKDWQAYREATAQKVYDEKMKTGTPFSPKERADAVNIFGKEMLQKNLPKDKFTTTTTPEGHLDIYTKDRTEYQKVGFTGQGAEVIVGEKSDRPVTAKFNLRSADAMARQRERKVQRDLDKIKQEGENDGILYDSLSIGANNGNNNGLGSNNISTRMVISEAENKIPHRQKLIDFSVKEHGGSFKGIFAGVGGGGIYYVKGFIDSFIATFKPSTYVNLYKSIFTKSGREATSEQLYETGQQISTTNPGLLFEIAGGLKGGELGFKTAGKIIPKVKYEIFTVPTQTTKASQFKSLLSDLKVGYVEQPKVVSYRGIAVETPRALEYFGIKKATEIVGIKSGVQKGKVRFGQTDFSAEIRQIPEGTQLGGNIAVKDKVLSPSTPLQTKILTKSAQKASVNIDEPLPKQRLQEALLTGQNIVKKTIPTQSKFIMKDNKLVTERLNEQGVNVFLKIAKEEKGEAVIFGSGARRLQIPESISEFVPRDIDIRLPEVTPEILTRVKTKAVFELEKIGYKARASPDIVEAVEVLTKDGKWKKAAEFKGSDVNNILEAEKMPEDVFGFKKEGKPIKINVAGEKYKFTRLSEELRGVSQGVFRVQKVNGVLDVFPAAKRIKDIESVLISAETLEQSQILPKGLRNDINKFKELYGKEIKSTGIKEDGIVFDYKTKSNKQKNDFNKAVSPVYSQNKSPNKIKSPSPSVSPSPSPRASPSPSPSSYPSASPYKSPSPNKSPSPFISPVSSPIPSPRTTSPSPSPITSPSPSPFVMPSLSPIVSPSPSPSPIPSPYIQPSPNPIPSPYIKRSNFSERKKKSIFRTKVRRKGKFATIGTFETEQAAGIAGIKNVLNTAAASFKIETEQGRAVKMPQFDRRFYSSRKESNVNIQKREFRIGTAGEKREITARGLAAIKFKKVNMR